MYSAVLPRPRAVRASSSLRLAALALLVLASACSDLPLLPETPEGTSLDRNSPPATAASVMVGASLWVDPNSRAREQADAWRSTRPDDAALMDRIAAQPQAVWLGDWYPDPYRKVEELTTRITAAGALPVFVVYNIPIRDCGLYSRGGAATASAYREWVARVAQGIGNRRAAVVLEPDAVAGMHCLSAEQVETRYQLIRDAVGLLKAGGRVAVYIDAGNVGWHPAATMAERLRRAGVDQADGFALNVSNFHATQDNLVYGEALSRAVGGKHFVIDTSRNGLGAAPDNQWCNPPGRALGAAPTTRTGHPLVDAMLWIKAPGESDGTCNGGPAAGTWWADYALGLARRSAQ